jgi:uncharacterized membrane protein YgdD (TMEM256/DUF423 family)
MNRFFLIAGSSFAGLAVVLGAFGAHALKSKLTPDQLQVFETGVRYQMYHAFALMLLYLVFEKTGSSLLNYSGVLFIAGIMLFSGSLYLLACNDILGLQKFKMILGPVTPLGGMCFIAGWVCLLLTAVKLKNL